MRTDYARTIGWISVALGVCSFFKPRALSLFPFDVPHLIVYWLLGMIGIHFAQSNVPERHKRWFACICGVVMIIQGIMGFFVQTLWSYQFTAPSNLVNLLFGVWGFWLGIRRIPQPTEED